VRARLVPLDNGAPIDIVKDMTLVGRRDDCDLRLEHKSVSKMHCVLVKTEGMLLLRDLGSTNGTRVNGQRVRRAILLPDDQLFIASYKFRVQFGNDLPAPRIEEHTQHLEPNEVANLLRQAKHKTLEDSDDEVPMQPLQPNSLPDVYPEDEPKE
jgi:pSer/pThr/pTyr-binding forkhead associated (FHA) protein